MKTVENFIMKTNINNDVFVIVFEVLDIDMRTVKDFMLLINKFRKRVVFDTMLLIFIIVVQ